MANNKRSSEGEENCVNAAHKYSMPATSLRKFKFKEKKVDLKKRVNIDRFKSRNSCLFHVKHD